MVIVFKDRITYWTAGGLAVFICLDDTVMDYGPYSITDVYTVNVIKFQL